MRLNWALAGLVLAFAAAGAGPALADPRIALVIGNAAYKDQPLANPVNDARAVGRRLHELGFAVIQRENATRQQIASAIGEFAARIGADSTALFYYAGHGLQVRGRNYLVPVDAEIDVEAAVPFAAIDIAQINEQMDQAGARAKVMVLDACRNNPFERRMRGAGPGRGLAPMDAARGSLVAFATAPGSVAADGEGANGVYTAALLKALGEPGLKAEEVFKRARLTVLAATNGAQTPWEQSALTGDLVLNQAAAPAAASAGGGVDREALFWQSIQASQRAADFEAYLAQFPQGVFAALARNRLAELKQPQPQQLAAAPAPTPVAAPIAAPVAKPPMALDPIDKDYVVKSQARLRDQPDLKAQVLATLKEGDTVRVLGRVKGQAWYQVERKGQAPGYVAATLLEDAASYQAASAQAASAQAASAQAASTTPAPAPAPPASRAPATQTAAATDHDGALARLAALARRTIEALPEPDADKRADRGEALAYMACALTWAGDEPGARRVFAQAAQLVAENEEDDGLVYPQVTGFANIGQRQAECGDMVGARDSLGRALKLAPQLRAGDDDYERYEAIAGLMLAMGDAERAIAHGDTARNAKYRARVRDDAAGTIAYKDDKEISPADRERALRWARDGLALAGSLCTGKDEYYVCQYLGQKLARLGDRDGARAAADRIADPQGRAQVQIALAEALIKADDAPAADRAGARAYLDAAMALARSVERQYGGDDYVRAAAVGGYARLGDAQAVEAAIAQIGKSEQRDSGRANAAYALIERGDLAGAGRQIEQIASLRSALYPLTAAARKCRTDGDAACQRRFLDQARAYAERISDPKERQSLGSAASNFAEAGDVEFALRLLDLMVEPAERHYGLYYTAKALAEDKARAERDKAQRIAKP